MSVGQIKTNFLKFKVLNKKNYPEGTYFLASSSLCYPCTLAYIFLWPRFSFTGIECLQSDDGSKSCYECILSCWSKHLIIITFHFSNILSIKSAKYNLLTLFPFQNFRGNSFFGWERVVS